MKHRDVVLPAAIALGMAAFAWSGAARAQDPDSTDESAPAPTATTSARASETKVENQGRPLIGAGIFLFATSYLPATAVAGSSERAADQRLYIPVAGPWLDLVNRGSCTAGACGSEMAYRSLIVTDGILQGLGALMTLVGLASDDEPAPAAPVARHDRDRDKAAVRVSPAQFGGAGYGVTAFGAF